MLEAEIRDTGNNVIDKVTLEGKVFGVEVKKDIIHAAVINYLANQRQGNHATKTRGLVSGGGKKPWKQKHTGRARHGSIRSPLWKGGGTTFGPLPRDYYYKLNKKLRRLALKSALTQKYIDSSIIFIDDVTLPQPKTKEMFKILGTLGLEGKSVLIVTDELNRNVLLSARNIVKVSVMRAADLNTYAVMNHNVLLITRKSLAVITGADNEQPAHDN